MLWHELQEPNLFVRLNEEKSNPASIKGARHEIGNYRLKSPEKGWLKAEIRITNEELIGRM